MLDHYHGSRQYILVVAVRKERKKEKEKKSTTDLQCQYFSQYFDLQMLRAHICFCERRWPFFQENLRFNEKTSELTHILTGN